MCFQSITVFSQKKNNKSSKSLHELQSEYYYSLADKAIIQQNYDGAIKLMRLAIIYDSKNFKNYFLRGYAKYLNNDKETAISDLDTAIQLNPKYAMAYSYRADAEEIYDKSKAYEDISQAINLETDNRIKYLYYNERISLRIDFLDWTGAYADCNKSLQINSKYNFRAYTLRAKINLNIGNYIECINDCNKAISIIPGKDFNPLYLRGMAKIKVGNQDSACDDFSIAKEMISNFTPLNKAINEYCK